MADSMMEWSVRDVREPMAPGSTVMDGWELKKLLGRGSFGNVWLAEKTLFGIRDRSAIKIILIPRDPDDIDAMRAEGFTDDSIRTELRRSVENAVREIRTMLDLQGHPAIVPYQGFDVIQYEEDDSWEIDIRMQLLTSLPEWLSANRITREDVIRMGLSLTDLLSVCEKENILHRDIKPANIFVDKLNNFKLGDFGLARVVSDSSSTHSRGVGTEAFMAPEVFRSGKYDHRADLYSLGLVLYWLLNNQSLPFASGRVSRSEAISRRLSGEKLPILPDTDPELDRIIRKACEADPEKRWKTAKEFHEALQSLSSVPFNQAEKNTSRTPRSAPDVTQEPHDASQDPAAQPPGKAKRALKKFLRILLWAVVVYVLIGCIAALCHLNAWAGLGAAVLIILLFVLIRKKVFTRFVSSRRMKKQADGADGFPEKPSAQLKTVRKLFWICTIAYLFLNSVDSFFYGWAIISRSLYQGSYYMISDFNNLLTFSSVSFVMFGMFPLLSIVLGMTKKRKTSLVFASFGLAAALLAGIMVFAVNPVIGGFWAMYPVALLILLFATIYGGKPWMTAITLAMGIATMVLSILLTTAAIRIYPDIRFRYPGSAFIEITFYATQLHILPFSRTLLLAAMAFGIRLLPSGKARPAVTQDPSADS